MMVIEEHDGEMQEAQQTCVKEFDMLERKFALESERLG